MNKKHLFVFALIALISCFGLAAQGVNEVSTPASFYGTVVEQTPASILVQDSDGQQMLFHIYSDTAMNTDASNLVPGSIVLVGYSGAATRSIPPQATALEIYWEGYAPSSKLENVETVRLESIDLGQGQMMVTEISSSMERLVRFDETTTWGFDASALSSGDVFKVQNNGIFTMSLPPQTFALKIFR
jgi:type 1 fimbria pilin